MATSNVTDSDVVALWKKINKNLRLCTVGAKFRVGPFRISEEKMKFTKCAEHNFSQDIFRINKVIKCTPRPVYEMEDLNKTPIVGQFYQEK